MPSARTLSVTPYGVPAPPKGGAFCICRSAQIKLPLRGQISPGRGKMSPQVTKGGIWHRAAMTERVCLFTEGIVTESVLALSVTFGDSSPKGRALGKEMKSLVWTETLPLCQGLPLWGRWHGVAVTERASPLKFAAPLSVTPPSVKKWLRNARRRF